MLLKCFTQYVAQQWPQDWKSSIFLPIPKKGNAKECSNYHTIALISRASKVMLKIPQTRLQQALIKIAGRNINNLRYADDTTLEEINPEYSLEGLMLNLKLQYFGHLIEAAD